MGLMNFFSTKTAVSSAMIRADIERTQGEIAAIQGKIASATSGLATMTDEQHVAAEANVASMRRSIARLDARIAALDAELPAVIEAEQAAVKAEADAALIKRAKAATKANTIEAKALLEQYTQHAEAIADILARLGAIDADTADVNKALRTNPVVESVPSYNIIHRTVAEQPATQQRAMVPHWIYRDAPRHPDEVNPGETEEAIRATIGSDGKPIPLAGVRHGRGGNVLTPTLEQREVVTRTASRRATYAPPLDEVRLPGGFAGQSYIWPRPS